MNSLRTAVTNNFQFHIALDHNDQIIVSAYSFCPGELYTEICYNGSVDKAIERLVKRISAYEPD